MNAPTIWVRAPKGRWHLLREGLALPYTCCYRLPLRIASGRLSWPKAQTVEPERSTICRYCIQAMQRTVR